ncbi:MAG TPA: ATP-binding cassette domain-containing protein [Chitinophagaceae bacterium]|nr:ATP-binding cassette domain-containing protein [Chitinophagaceae bacterium]
MTEEMTIQQKVKPVKESEKVLVIEDLYKSFGNNQVLAGFSLVLRKGENVAVLGKSGSGKSVLIKCIIGLLTPDKGSINVLGSDIESLGSHEMDQLRTKIGFLFQSNALYDSMTVRENLEFPLRRHWIKISAAETERKVLEVLTNVGLAHTVDMMPAELSGGMRKRIALARTLILEPQIILYDEPTTGLDPITGKEISNLIKEMGEKYDTSALIISHDMSCIRVTTDRVVMLIDGKCYADGTYEFLKKNNDPKVKQFFE